MLAMLAAVTMAAAPAPVAAGTSLLATPQVACKPQGRYQTDWIAPATDPALAYRNGSVRPQRLEDMPKPNLEKAVLRTVAGCAVPVVVSYGVGR